MLSRYTFKLSTIVTIIKKLVTWYYLLFLYINSDRAIAQNFSLRYCVMIPDCPFIMDQT